MTKPQLIFLVFFCAFGLLILFFGEVRCLGSLFTALIVIFAGPMDNVTCWAVRISQKGILFPGLWVSQEQKGIIQRKEKDRQGLYCMFRPFQNLQATQQNLQKSVEEFDHSWSIQNCFLPWFFFSDVPSCDFILRWEGEKTKRSNICVLWHNYNMSGR